MSFLDLFKPKKPEIVTVQSTLPEVVKNEIMHGRLPILKTNRLLLKNGEVCHYIERAIYEKRDVKKRYIKNRAGYSMPGLIFKDTRVHFGNGQTDVVDNVTYESINGALFITNKRVVFTGETCGFDKSIDKISATIPYGNCIKFQLEKETLTVFVPDGMLANRVLQLIN